METQTETINPAFNAEQLARIGRAMQISGFTSLEEYARFAMNQNTDNVLAAHESGSSRAATEKQPA